MKKLDYALVLSGGSIKGAWQAGAIAAVTKKLGTPGYIYGISVGSLNATLLAQYDDGAAVASFWRKNVTSPKVLVKRHSWAEILWKSIWGKFNGYLDTTPLRGMLDSTVDTEMIQVMDGHVLVGLTNINTGKIIYSAPTCSSSQWCDILMASTAIPVAMPPVIFSWGKEIFGDDPYFDGGLRDIAPLSVAISSGYDKIVVIACSPKEMEPNPINVGNPVQVVLRSVDILTNEVLNSDIETCLHVNEYLPAYPKKRMIDLTVIRPAKELKVDIENFNHKDVTDMITTGFDKASFILSK